MDTMKTNDLEKTGSFVKAALLAGAIFFSSAAINDAFAQKNATDTGPLNNVTKTEEKVNEENKQSKIGKTIHSLFTGKKTKTIERHEETLEKQANLIHSYQMQIKALEEKDITNEEEKEFAKRNIDAFIEEIAKKDEELAKKKEELEQKEKRVEGVTNMAHNLFDQILELKKNVQSLKQEKEELSNTIEKLKKQIAVYETTEKTTTNNKIGQKATDSIMYTRDGMYLGESIQQIEDQIPTIIKDKKISTLLIDIVGVVGLDILELEKGTLLKNSVTFDKLALASAMITEKFKIDKKIADLMVLYIVSSIKDEGGEHERINKEAAFNNKIFENEDRKTLTSVKPIGVGSDGIVEMTFSTGKKIYVSIGKKGIISWEQLPNGYFVSKETN